MPIWMITISEPSMTIKPRIFSPYFKVNAFVFSIQIGYANLSYVIHPDNIPKARKSLMVHINAIIDMKFYFVEIS